MPKPARKSFDPQSPAKPPALLGYRMPAEWEPHTATWLAWPHNLTDWPGKFQPIPWVYAEIVRHLSRVEDVEILVNDKASEARAREILQNANALRDSVHFHRFRTDRGWTRDFAPIFVKRDVKRGSPESGLALNNWGFNAWAKYDDWRKDVRAAQQIARHCAVPTWEPSFPVAGKARRVILEGGSIDVNGQGSLLTTEECLLSQVQQRNPGMSRADLEQVFAEYLGVSNVLWLGRGIVGDDTHGHIDDLARFVSADTVVAAYEANSADPNHAVLADNWHRLRGMTGQNGQKLQVIQLPMPGAIVFKGRRLPVSYANFYIANRLVIVPVFNDRNDRLALNILSDLFPDREIVPVYCGDLVWGLGTLHCMTQQQPAP